MRPVELTCDGWSSGPVWPATTFTRRLRGIHAVPAGEGALIPGRSVHGLTLRRRLWVAGLDPDRRVVAVRMLRPGRVIGFPRPVCEVLELPVGCVPPPPGATLAVSSLGPWPAP